MTKNDKKTSKSLSWEAITNVNISYYSFLRFITFLLTEHSFEIISGDYLNWNKATHNIANGSIANKYMQSTLAQCYLGYLGTEEPLEGQGLIRRENKKEGL